MSPVVFIWLCLIGLSVGNDLDLGPVASVRITRDNPSAKQISFLLGKTYRCDESKGPSCTLATMCQAHGVTELGLREAIFTPQRAGNFTCRMSGIEQNFVVYYNIVALRGEVRAKALENLKLIAPDGGLKASIENIGVEAKDGRLSVYNLPFYDDVSRSFLINIVMENFSVYEVPLRVVNNLGRCHYLESLTQGTVSRDLEKSDINSFENRIAAFKCIGEEFSDDGPVLDGACFPENDQNKPSSPIFLRRASDIGRKAVDCFGYSVTHPKDNIVGVTTSSEPPRTPRTPSFTEEQVREPRVTNPAYGSDPIGSLEEDSLWWSVYYFCKALVLLILLILLISSK